MNHWERRRSQLDRDTSPHPGSGVKCAPVMVSGPLRMAWIWPIALLGVVLLAAGCTSSSQSFPAGQSPSTTQGYPPSPADQGPPTSQVQRALPSSCTHTITGADDVQTALDAAAAGDTLCFSGGDLTDTDLAMTRSGTADAPITLAADGATVHEVQLKADHVVLEGFTVAGGGGVLLEGAGITARNNTVHDTDQGGITCDPCTDS
ncbi:MAG: hypothetical protein ACJ72I_09270, partial [Pseudonocardiaceae bacterium]